MESINALIIKISQNKYEEGSEHWVNITHINDPYNFYIRLWEFRVYVSALASRGEKFNIEEIFIRSQVVYKSRTTKSYLRGQICFKKSEESFDIFAPDYGFVDKNVQLKYIYKPLHKHNIPPLAMPCSLAYCKPVENNVWSKDSVCAMENYCQLKRAKIIVQTVRPNKLIVELYNTCPDEVGQHLIKTGYALFALDLDLMTRNIELSVSKLKYQFIELPVGTAVHVKMQMRKALNEFHVTRFNDYKESTKRGEEMSNFIRGKGSLKLHEVRVGMPVAVQPYAGSTYERGIITSVSIPRHAASIYFVDSGNIGIFCVGQLKPMKKDIFFSYPAISIYCSIPIYQAHKFRKYMTPGYEFYMKIKEAGDSYKKPYLVSILPMRN